MQITLSDKLLRKAVQFYVEDHIYMMYSKRELAQANVADKALMVHLLMTDEKFMKGIEKYVAKYVADYDVLRDAMEDAPSRVLTATFKALDRLEA